MSNKLAGGIKAGSTSVSLPILLRKTSDGTEETGKVAADMTAYYWRQGGTPTTLTSLTNLSTITSSWTAGGVKEADVTHQPGLYRLDVDDAAFATGADWVIISVKVSGDFVFYEKYSLETQGAAEVFTETNSIKSQTDQLTFSGSNVAADVKAINGNSTAAVNQALAARAVYVGSITNASPTITQFDDSAQTGGDNNWWNGRIIFFGPTGTCAGQMTNITGYNHTTKTYTYTALTRAPAQNDPYLIF